MLTVTAAQLHAWLVLFLWPLCRVAGAVGAAPVLGHSALPRMVKVGVAAVITLAIAPTLPAMPPVPVWSYVGIAIVAEQILIGVAIGFVMRVALAAAMAAGDYIGLNMELGFAGLIGAENGENTAVLAEWLYLTGLLAFLAVDGPMMTIQALDASFRLLPVAGTGVSAGGFYLLASTGAAIFAGGVAMALPLIIAMLVINTGLGILNRAAPQMTLFSVGFPITLLFGLFLLGLSMTSVGRYVDGLFQWGLDITGHVLRAFS